MARSIVTSGVPALDFILSGGLTSGRVYLLEGDPGTGKTTLALQFAMGGGKDEKSLYISLSESLEELSQIFESHGWAHDPAHLELVAIEQEQNAAQIQKNTMFHPSEVELTATTQRIIDEVERVQPQRVVIDSMSEFRLMAHDAYRYRRQVLALKQYFAAKGCTVLFLDDQVRDVQERHIASIAHGVISLEHMPQEYGVERRRLRVAKMRGSTYRGGYHDFSIVKGGLTIYRRLVASENRRTTERGTLLSGINELDAITGGGIEKGSSVLVMGVSGTGKSTILTQFATNAASCGEKSMVFTFDESVETMLVRADGMGMPLREHVEAGLVVLKQVDPAELSPGELSDVIRCAVEENHVAIVCIDSLNGYLYAMPGEKYLLIHLHELFTYLGQKGVTIFTTLNQQGIFTNLPESRMDVSYLADTIFMIRYFEAAGKVENAISVLKKRTGTHEKTIRRLYFEDGRLRISDPLCDLQGVFTGYPVFLRHDEHQ